MQEQQDAAGKALLSAHEVQSMLHIDRSTVYRMAEDGRLPAIKVGRQWRFPAARIAALVEGAPTQGPAAQVIDIAAMRSTGPTTGSTIGSTTAPTTGSTTASTTGSTGTATTWPTPDAEVATAVVQVAAELLGVMMVVTDMDGRPLTEVSNPCPWFAERLADPALLETCAQEWRQLADDPDLEPRFHTGRLGFECARAFVRSGTSLVGMVLAGGIAPQSHDGDAERSQAGDAAAYDGLHRLNTKQRRKVLSSLPKVAATLSRVPSRTWRADTPGQGTDADQTPTAPDTGAAGTPTSERNEQ